MGDATSISWTDATWNPIRGCSRVSEGCRHCYAETVAARFSGLGQAYEGLADRAKAGSKWTGVVRLIGEHLADPLRWKRPRRIFVNSMSDLFHESLTNERIAAVFGVMAAAPQHTFQVLTKRARRMREWFAWVATAPAPFIGLPVYDDYINERQVCCRHAWMLPDSDERLARREVYGLHPSDAVLEHQRGPWPLPNVWLGVSVENQAAAEERIPDLLAAPAAVRFLSCEPLLGAVDLTEIRQLGAIASSALEPAIGIGMDRPAIDWVIAGCESGHGARRCDVEWLRTLRDQCTAARVPFFLKQAQSVPAVGGPLVTLGKGAREKGRGADGRPVIELPYLDGVQHASFPETPR